MIKDLKSITSTNWLGGLLSKSHSEKFNLSTNLSEINRSKFYLNKGTGTNQIATWKDIIENFSTGLLGGGIGLNEAECPSVADITENLNASYRLISNGYKDNQLMKFSDIDITNEVLYPIIITALAPKIFTINIKFPDNSANQFSTAPYGGENTFNSIPGTVLFDSYLSGQNLTSLKIDITLGSIKIGSTNNNMIEVSSGDSLDITSWMVIYGSFTVTQSPIQFKLTFT